MAYNFGTTQEAKVTSLGNNVLKIKWKAPFNVEPNASVCGFQITVQNMESKYFKWPVHFDVIGDSVYEINVGGFKNEEDCRAQVTTLMRKKYENVPTELSTRRDLKTPNVTLKLIKKHQSIIAELDFTKCTTNEIFRGYRLRYGARYHIMKDVSLKDINTTKYTIPDLMQGTEYEFRVAYINASGVGRETIKCICTPEGAPTGPPVDIKHAFQTQEAVCISWKSPIYAQRHGRIVNYQIQFYKTEQPAQMIDRNVGKKYVVFGNLEEDTEYAFQINAYTSQGSGPFSSIQTFQTEIFAEAPNSVRAIPTSSTSIMVTWQHFPTKKDIDGYYIFYTPNATEDLNEWQQKRTYPTDSVHLKNLKEFTQYTIVTATVTNNKIGKLSKRLTIETKPEIPLNVKVICVKRDSITFSWDPPVTLNPPFYTILYGASKKFVDSQGITRINHITEKEVTTTQRTYTLSNLIPYTKYNISVRATDCCNYSPSILVSSCTLMDRPPAIIEPKIYSIGKEVKLVLSGASEEFGPISHYYLVVVLDNDKQQPNDFSTVDLISNSLRKNTSRSYITAKFLKNKLPYIFVLGDNTIYEQFVNEQLEYAKKYRVFIRAVVASNKDLCTSSPYSECFTNELI